MKKEDIIIEEGYPRNDYLSNYEPKDVNRIKQEIGIPLDKKVLLYAPTWRDNNYKLGAGYSHSFAVDFDRLQKEIGDEYVLLIRSHYFIKSDDLPEI